MKGDVTVYIDALALFQGQGLNNQGLLTAISHVTAWQMWPGSLQEIPPRSLKRCRVPAEKVIGRLGPRGQSTESVKLADKLPQAQLKNSYMLGICVQLCAQFYD